MWLEEKTIQKKVYNNPLLILGLGFLSGLGVVFSVLCLFITQIPS